jgi:capsular polysaccharide biosynthesis protein
MESLGRLAMINEKELKDYTIVVDVNAPKFVTESLIFLFELDKSKIFYNSNKKIEVSSLLVPSFPITRDDSTNWTNIYFPEVIQKLNEISLNRTYKEAAKTNFIISRKNATQRRIINSETFFERYSDLNFKIFFLEEMNFKEQMQLFRNANIVISTHGAGLVNLLFSEEAEVIEFFPSNRTKRDAFYFYQITQVLKIKHSIIEYDSVNSEQDLILNQKHFNLLDEILNRN